MIILSKHRDYYDYVSTNYGGGDPNVVYDRRKKKGIILESLKTKGRVVRGEEKEYFIFPFKGNLRLFTAYEHSFTFRKFKSIDVRTVIICGEAYPILFGDYNNNGTNIHAEPEVLNRKHPLYEFLDEAFIGKMTNFKSQLLLNLCKELRMPVFEIVFPIGSPPTGENVYIKTIIPNLGELGFAKIVSPERMWQRISYFCGNTINRNPDESPPSKMTNEEKILAAGFDKRVSFRKRN